jgi:hypothetical protein
MIRKRLISAVHTLSKLKLMNYQQKVEFLLICLIPLDNYDYFQYCEFLEFLVRISDIYPGREAKRNFDAADLADSVPIHFKLNSLLKDLLDLIGIKRAEFHDKSDYHPTEECLY